MKKLFSGFKEAFLSFITLYHWLQINICKQQMYISVCVSRMSLLHLFKPMKLRDQLWFDHFHRFTSKDVYSVSHCLTSKDVYSVSHCLTSKDVYLHCVLHYLTSKDIYSVSHYLTSKNVYLHCFTSKDVYLHCGLHCLASKALYITLCLSKHLSCS